MNKYHARKTTVDGITFDSQKEAMRWCELKLMQMAGLISELDRQIQLIVCPKSDRYRAVHYVADFCYRDEKTGKLVYEDVKGCKKGAAYQLFDIKRKIIYYHSQGEIDIKEI